MFDSYLSLLRQYIAIPSISTDPAHRDSITQCASWLHQLLTQHGFSSQIITWYGNPVIIAKYSPLWRRGVGGEVLIYGHYDVQPADISEWWTQDPFDLQVTDDKLIARWAIDNKWQLMIHLATVLDLIKRGELAYNVTMLIEWDEETWWWDMVWLIRDYAHLLDADLCLVSDGEMIWRWQPVIETGFRWWANMTLKLQTATTDAHSGIYWGILPNAAHELSQLISKMHDKQGQTLPLLLHWLQLPSLEERGRGWGLPNVDLEIVESTGAKSLLKPAELDSYTVTGNLPTMQITGIESGYIWVWYRNAVPSTASCKMNLRLIAWQDPTAIMKTIETRISEQIPHYVDHTITWSDSRPATIITTDSPWINHTKDILEQVFATSVPFKYCGWSLPIVWLLQELGLTCVMVPLANQDCLMHGVGENFALETCRKWLEFSRQFFSIPM